MRLNNSSLPLKMKLFEFEALYFSDGGTNVEFVTSQGYGFGDCFMMKKVKAAIPKIMMKLVTNPNQYQLSIKPGKMIKACKKKIAPRAPQYDVAKKSTVDKIRATNP